MEDGTVVLPRRSLIVLCGPAGAGKSTFAREFVQRNGLASTAVVSSDACRMMLCDTLDSVAPADWPILRSRMFELFLTVVGLRLSLGRPTLADGINLRMEVLPRLRELAAAHGCHSALVVFDMALGTCLSQNAPRARPLPEEQIRLHRRALDAALPRFAEQGWDRSWS
jgi:protein phosphatase